MKKLFLLSFLLCILNISTVYAETTSSRSAVKEKITTRREEFQTKKETLKDAKKKALIERIDQKIANINKKHTTQMLEHLTKMITILDKLQSRVDIAKTKGKDVSGTVTAIAKARTAILTAQTAVKNQAAKDYVLSVSTENKLRIDVGATVKQLEQDLRIVNQSVIAAKQAVAEAIKSVRTIKGVDDDAK